MANSVLIDIGIHDDIQDVIRKTNDNFRRVSRQVSNQTLQATISKGESSIQNVVDGALGNIRAELNSAIASLEATEKRIISNLNEKIKEIDAKIEELGNLLDSLSSSEAQNIVAMLATNIEGATASGMRIVLPAGTKIATGNLNIIHGNRSVKTHTANDSNDLTI